MADLLAFAPATGPVPVMAGVAQVHEVLDRVDSREIGPVTGRDVAEADRAIARLEALRLSLVAAADQQDAGAQAGMTGTSAWLAAKTRSCGGKAASDVALATALEESLPMTRDALAGGALSAAHASVIAHTTARLPESMTPEERAKVELALVAQAKRVDPARLQRAARRALLAAERSAAEADAHEDAELRSEEERAEARVRLTMHDNKDGTVTGHFTVPTLAGSILRKAIQQMTAPRRQHRTGSAAGASGALGAGGGNRPAGAALGAHGAHRAHRAEGTLAGCPGASGHGADGPAQLGDRWAHVDAGPGRVSDGSARPGDGWAQVDAGPSRVSDGSARPGEGPSRVGDRPERQTRGSDWRDVDWAHRQGQALVELLEHLDTDRLNGKVAATVVVTIDHDRLRENLGAAHLDTGHDLSASETRRLACSAGVLPAVLGGTSLPLDLGRTQRFFTEAQRVALATTYEECAADDCDRPYAWCELHHEDPWARDGRTDLHLAVPLCRFHHRRVHDPGYDAMIRTHTDGRKSLVLRRLPR